MALADLLGVMTVGLTVAGLLVRIVWIMGKLVQQFGDHMAASAKLHEDVEFRLRALEHRRSRPRPGPSGG